MDNISKNTLFYVFMKTDKQVASSTPDNDLENIQDEKTFLESLTKLSESGLGKITHFDEYYYDVTPQQRNFESDTMFLSFVGVNDFKAPSIIQALDSMQGKYVIIENHKQKIIYPAISFSFSPSSFDNYPEIVTLILKELVMNGDCDVFALDIDNEIAATHLGHFTGSPNVASAKHSVDSITSSIKGLISQKQRDRLMGFIQENEIDVDIVESVLKDLMTPAQVEAVKYTR